MLKPFKKLKPRKPKAIKSRKHMETKLLSKARIMIDAKKIPVIQVVISNSKTPTILEKRYFFSTQLLKMLDHNLPFNESLVLRGIDEYTPKPPYKSLHFYHNLTIPLKCRLMIIEDYWRVKSLVITVNSDLDWGRLLYVNVQSTILAEEVARLNQIGLNQGWFDALFTNTGKSGYCEVKGAE